LADQTYEPKTSYQHKLKRCEQLFLHTTIHPTFYLYFCIVEIINAHIEALLSENDCVIVPGLGAFILNNVPAAWEDNQQKLSAPHHVVYFNQSLHHDDGLLTETICIAEQITYRKAARYIANEVAIWQQQLRNSQQVSIGRLGTLTLNEKHQIDFLPAHSFSFLPDNIGNYSVRIPSFRSHISEHRQLVLHIPHPSKFVASVAAVLLLFFLFPIGQYHSESNYAKLNPFDYFINQLPNAVNDVNKEHDTTTLANSLNTISKPIRTTPVAVIKPSEISTKKSWHLVVGTFFTETQAKKSAVMLQQQETIPLSVLKHHNLFRIVAQSYSKKEVALAALQTLRKRHAFTTAWIVCDSETPTR